MLSNRLQERTRDGKYAKVCRRFLSLTGSLKKVKMASMPFCVEPEALTGSMKT